MKTEEGEGKQETTCRNVNNRKNHVFSVEKLLQNPAIIHQIFPVGCDSMGKKGVRRYGRFEKHTTDRFARGDG